jgi:site-specific DNA-methyltransferase (adenine-specific)
VDVIVTSPPYNINKEYSYYSDDKEGEEYLNWLYRVAQKSFSILKDNGSFCNCVLTAIHNLTA